MKELRDKQAPELRKLLREQQETLQSLRFKASADQLKNVREIRRTRVSIARILTVLSERTTTHHHAERT